MKVLMTADAVGGVWTYALELIAGLGEKVEVVLAVMGPPPTAAQRAELGKLELAGYEHRGYALEWMDEPWDDVARAGEWLLDLQRRHGAELVHLNGYAHAALPFGVPVVVAGHSCVLSWHAALRRPVGREWRRYEDAVTEGLAFADALVAPTAAMLHELELRYAPSCPARVIPNGLDGGPIGDKRRFVLGVGRAWDEAKNLGALERVAARLPWPVLIAGEGGSLGRVDAAALETLYAHASVFAEPARYEPFGLAALEAGRSGCALVLGDIASLREVWGDAALFVDPFDDELLAETLAGLIADPDRVARLGAAARGRAATFTRERMAAAYRDLYASVASAAPAKAVA